MPAGFVLIPLSVLIGILQGMALILAAVLSWKRNSFVIPGFLGALIVGWLLTANFLFL